MGLLAGEWRVSSHVYLKRSVLVAWDALCWVVALTAFVLTRYDFVLSDRVWQAMIGYVVAAIALQVAGGFAFHLYLGRSRIGSFDEVTALGTLVAGISVVLGAVFFLTQPVFSRGVAFAMPAFAFILMAAGRWAFRTAFGDDRRRSGGNEAVRVVVYGAGDTGHQVARLVDTTDDAPYSIVGFVDDNPDKRYLRIRGHRVLGRGPAVVDVARARGAETVILAVSAASPQLLQGLSARCKEAGLHLVVVPPVREMIGGQVQLSQLRELNVEDLLGRRPVETDLQEISFLIAGQVVLVTGAGGSIGSELSRQVHALGPARLLLLDRDESALHAAQLSIDGSGLLDSEDLVLCDIRDEAALAKVFDRHRPDVVFHAAARKPLPLLERHPHEGWKTKVVGARHLRRCAWKSGVTHFVNISTDKAADATSVLGQSKRLSERLTAWYAVRSGRPYLSVRFGNVLGSRGSVLDTFQAQIDRGGPVTVTHRDVTRFFMTIPEACQLVLEAGAIGAPGDVLVLDMGEPVRIMDVAQRLIEESDEDIEIRFTGLRQGEKLHEVLFSSEEVGTPSGHPLISRVAVPELDPAAIPSEDATSDRIGELLRSQSSTVGTAQLPGAPATGAMRVVS